MRFTLVSDIHLTSNDKLRIANTEQADVLVIAGDLITLGNIVPSGTVSDMYNADSAATLKRFLADACTEFKTVMWVFGNHEYWGTNINQAVADARKWLQANDLNNVHILDNDTIEVEGVLFHGTTLWTNLNRDNPIATVDAAMNMRDYQYIGNDNGVLHTGYMRKLHNAAVEFIASAVASDKRSVVVTHHHPSFESIQPEYLKGHIQYSYASDLVWLVGQYCNNVVYWCAGHIHAPIDYTIGYTNVRMVANPRGYVGYEPDAATFKPKTFEV